MTQETKLSDYLEGCGSHSCIVKKPQSLGTNGPCRCTREPRSIRVIQALQEHIKEFESNK